MEQKVQTPVEPGADATTGPGGSRPTKIGPRIRLRRRRSGTPMFESGEHTFLGNSATLHFEGGDVEASARHLQLMNGLQLTYGNILALGGDFYGDPKQPISDGSTPGEREARFRAAFQMLAADERATREVPLILQVMGEEIAAVNLALRSGRQPSAAYRALGDSLSKKWNRITGGGRLWVPPGRYLKLAATNWDHFVQHAILAYQAGHHAAMLVAIDAHSLDDAAERESALATAYAMNAFADHFMTDLFSAGHMRTPRRALYECSALRREGSGYAARYMHDEDSMWGLYVTNRRGDSWIAYGDKKFGDSYDSDNARMVMDAVQASIDEVYAAFDTGACPEHPDDYAALRITPRIDALMDRRHPGNFAAYFVIGDDGAVLARTNPRDLEDFRWDAQWTVLTALANQKRIGHHTAPPGRFLPAPPEAPALSGWTSNTSSPPTWKNGTRVRYAASFFENYRPPGAASETEQWGPACNESDRSPWSDWADVDGHYKPTVTIPIDPTGRAAGRRIYRQFEGAAPQLVGQVDDNTTADYADVADEA